MPNDPYLRNERPSDLAPASVNPYLEQVSSLKAVINLDQTLKSEDYKIESNQDYGTM